MQNGTGLYRHILFAGDVQEDPGYWSTGNAWAVYGMLRVLVTMMHSQTYSDAMEAQKSDLKSWIVETLQASYASLDVSHVLPAQPAARLTVESAKYRPLAELSE